MLRDVNHDAVVPHGKPLSFLLRSLAVLLLLCVAAFATPPDEDEGALGSLKPRIPEPLVFDLVRPLGAVKGEFEVNTLFIPALTGPERTFEWAPEVEVALTDGFALEFELPLENGVVSAYKFALQGTLGTTEIRGKKRMIHGWQAIGVWRPSPASWKADLLYINGVRFSRRFSYLGLNGLGARDSSPKPAALLANNSLFFTPRRETVYGLETNLEVRPQKGSHLLVLPQRHFRIGRHYNLQFGLGWNRHGPGKHAFVLGWRFIREL